MPTNQSREFFKKKQKSYFAYWPLSIVNNKTKLVSRTWQDSSNIAPEAKLPHSTITETQPFYDDLLLFYLGLCTIAEVYILFYWKIDEGTLLLSKINTLKCNNKTLLLLKPFRKT